MMRRRLLGLGPGDGWHASELRRAAQKLGCTLEFGSYESLAASISSGTEIRCDAGAVESFDGLLTRTMPAGNLEQITFRLAALHRCQRRIPSVVNPIRGLEIAIDKFATLAVLERLGYAVPATRVVQSRSEAMTSFRELGGDCVVKPLFGGEGRGVMRVNDEQLAWTIFSALAQVGSIFYLQEFCPPGGCDTRLLVIGDEVRAMRRTNGHDFRTNVAGGATIESIEVRGEHFRMASRILASTGLRFAAIDIIECDDGTPRVIEVNGVPGWRGAQRVNGENLAERVIDLLLQTPHGSPETVASD